MGLIWTLGFIDLLLWERESSASEDILRVEAFINWCSEFHGSSPGVVLCVAMLEAMELRAFRLTGECELSATLEKEN